MRRRLSGRKPPILALGTIAASSLLLTGCGDDAPTDTMYSSPEQCISAGVDRELCQTAYEDAMKAHLANAPRFNVKGECETAYGDNQCSEQRSNGGSFFTPFMTGYLLSSTINNITDYYSYRRRQEQSGSSYGSSGSYWGSSPIYRNRSGQTVTTVGTGRSRDTAITTTSPTKPVNVNTRSVSRSGFGGRSSFGFGG